MFSENVLRCIIFMEFDKKKIDDIEYSKLEFIKNLLHKDFFGIDYRE